MFTVCFKKCSKKKSSGITPAEKKKLELERIQKASADLGIKDIHTPLLGTDDIEEDDQPEEDPYLSLGYGMVAYFSMLKALILMFSIFCLMVVPVIGIYASYNGLESGANYGKTKYSLGNMGFTEHICKHIFTTIDGNYKFACRTGTIEKLSYAGILPKQDEKPFYGDYIGYCNNPEKYDEVEACMPAIKLGAITQHINENCKDKSECTSALSVAEMLSDDKTTAPANCFAKGSIIYLQYECTQPESITDT